jgi:predicted anti-sigma-YlaC factor YlaD
MSDPKLTIGSNYCKCPACGEYFTNVANFDMHRRGDATARECINPAELVTKTGKRRLTLNARGYWSRPGGFHERT